MSATPSSMPLALTYRAGLTRRQLRNLRRLSGLTRIHKVRAWYDNLRKTDQIASLS